MTRNYDNWERLVAAVIKRQQLWELFHAQSRSPSNLSDASDFSSISNLGEKDVSFGYSIPWISSPYNMQQQAEIPESENPGLDFTSDYKPAFDFEDVLRARAKTVLRKGTFGRVHTCKLGNETVIAVKRLNMVNITEHKFKKHMEIAGDVRHENVPLRADYYSKDEKLMIYDYYSGGSVSALLHGETGETRANFPWEGRLRIAIGAATPRGNASKNHPSVPWKVRLRIAIGAARGIRHIHTQNGGKLVHGNIRSSNIFLNSKGYGVVSDTGLASMIPATFPKSSRCYAPEVKHTLNVSQASDVYSFGVLLLELLTRKSPHSSHGHEAVDLVTLITSVSQSEWSTKVFDENLLLNPSMTDQIVRMFEIGISCVAKSPKERPVMSAVAKMIEDISMVSKGIEVSKLYHEDLLFSFDRVLGYGKYGTSYNAILEDGNVIFVKRLKDVNVTNEEFQQHMEVVGRMGQENVAELRSYYYSRDEKFLVYDYYNEDSLSARLHGNKDSGKKPLDWPARLKIALGAAKGVAHIHKKNRQKLAHGNISSSNILLNEWQYGIVSDVALGKLVIENWEVSQASDVHSFGVVLLELLFAKSREMLFERDLISFVSWIDGFVVDDLGSALFDPDIWSSREVNMEMMGMLRLAVQCVAHPPESRPTMTLVVKMLEAIRKYQKLNRKIKENS